MGRVGFLAVFAVLAAATTTAIDYPAGLNPLIIEWVESMQGEILSQAPDGAEIMQPLVNIKNGTVRGSLTQSITGHTIYQYLGVPYAKAPVGELRFQAPQPYEGWGEDIYNATRHPHACPQFLTNLTIADEDCLFVSIYSRREGGGVGTGPLLPVVYWIHGGGLAFGQNSYYDPSKILEENVVLVTTQYRLGPLGFFYTGDNTVSGNNGMKDQVQGLRWIQENIAAFGGDPNQVTVMGESAGGYSSLYMLISPLAHGLFHKVVAMSGPSIMEFGLDRNPAESATRLGEQANCTWDTNQELVDCLMEVDPIALSVSGVNVIMEDFKNFQMRLSGISPVVEGDVPGAFLPDDPIKLLKEGAIADVPVVLGTVQHEGILALAAAYYLVLDPEGLVNDTDYVRNQLMTDMLSTWNIDESGNGAPISQALLAGYVPPGIDRGNFTDFQYQLMDVTTVMFMKAALLKQTELLVQRLTSPVYMYNFEYYNQYQSSLYNYVFDIITLALGGRRPPMKSGICHADDLMYMFKLPFILGPTDTTFSRYYVHLFTNFIVHGNPTPVESEYFPNWPAYTLDNREYMKLDWPFEVVQDFTSNWKPGMPM